MSDPNAPADHPRVVILPPVLFFALLALTALLQWLVPLRWPWPGVSRWIGGGIFIAAFLFAAWARALFRRAGTNVNPRRPATTIVSHGPYRMTRNPMYLSMVVAFIGATLAMRSMWGFGLLVVLAFVLHFGVIRREEPYLEAKFGEMYRSYRQRVRRWI
jgi:protein-S-isoprenylcysteine O-methyltransferase Ste14